MRQFKDNQGRTWKLRVTIPILRQLKEDGVIDLLADRDPFKSIPKFLEATVESQLDAIGIAVEQTKQDQKYEVYDFASSFNEETIWSAAMAFLESFADFYPTHSKLIETILTKARKQMDRSREMVTEKIDSGAFDEMIESSMSSQAVGSGSISSQDTSD
jgi:hypothetical protein